MGDNVPVLREGDFQFLDGGGRVRAFGNTSDKSIPDMLMRFRLGELAGYTFSIFIFRVPDTSAAMCEGALSSINRKSVPTVILK